MTKFKKSEWQYGITKHILTSLLQNYYIQFNIQITGWTEDDITHFLQLHHWTYPDRTPYTHHFHTCKTIIEGLST